MQTNIVSNEISYSFPITSREYFADVASVFAPAHPMSVFATYWYFAAERQAIFFRRLSELPVPWTEDPILNTYKFTNAYRASDRVSQFLIRNVIYSGEQTAEEIFFRTILFKIFNRIKTWQLLQHKLGEISFSDYTFDKYDRVLTEAIEAKERIFTAAYIMPSGHSTLRHPRKHRNYLLVLGEMMKDGMPSRIAKAKSLQSVFQLLRSYPMFGDFLAYQFAIDLNYSPLINFSEMDFVMAGPGARSGIKKCFSDLGGLTEEQIIHRMTQHQEGEFARLGIVFPSLGGRALQLIDCQNLFCEVDKYARVAHPEASCANGRTRIKQRFSPQVSTIDYWYPPKWELKSLFQEGK